MRVLGIESSGTRGGIALLESGQVRGTLRFEKAMVHGRELAPSIRSLLDELHWAPESLDLIACDIGPGSYTGRRVGLAAAKGLALALQRPLLGVSSLDGMAEAARGLARVLCPAIDAKWEQIYGAVYEDGRRTTDYLAEKPDVFAARVPKGATVIGDALDQHGGLFRDIVRGPREFWDPRPDVGALLAQSLYEAGARHDPATLVPLYLRPPEAQLKFGRKT